jgi:hypothetical protein
MTDPFAEAGKPSSEPFGLRWAVKPSFVDYVARTRDGRAYLSGGVAVNACQELVFQLDTQAPAMAPAGADHAFTFRGDVRFVAHFGMLFVRIAEPRAVLRGGQGELLVLDPESADGAPLRLVTFSVAGPAVEDGRQCWEATDVRLTAEGAELFGDVYAASEPFAPLTITVPAPSIVFED